MATILFIRTCCFVQIPVVDGLRSQGLKSYYEGGEKTNKYLSLQKCSNYNYNSFFTVNLLSRKHLLRFTIFNLFSKLIRFFWQILTKD